MISKEKAPFCFSSNNDKDNSILIPLTKQGISTLQTMSDGENMLLQTSPFCFETHDNQREIKGWVLSIAGDSKCKSIPVHDKYFHGISICKCEVDEYKILEMLQNVEQTRIKLGEALSNMFRESKKQESKASTKRASWSRCRPIPYQGHPASLQQAKRNSEGVLTFELDECFVSQNVPIIDSEDWTPELSPDGFVGFYHYFHHDENETRHYLYCACQSYLPRACLDFADILYKVGDFCSASYVAMSEEAQWIKSVCSRNRARIIADVCSAMGIRVPLIDDYNSSNSSHRPKLAVVQTETLHHDIQFIRPKNKVLVYNHCSNSKEVVCNMAPWEGIWQFHNDDAVSTLREKNYVLPTTSPRMNEKSCAQNPKLSYTCADPRQCQVLRLWCDASLESTDRKSRFKLYLYPKKSDSVTSTSLLSGKPTKTEVSKSTGINGKIFEGLDPDVARAFEVSLKKSTFNYAKEEDYFISKHCVDDSTYEPNIDNYLRFDEAVLDVMSKMGWSRRQKILRLIPMCCGMFEYIQAHDEI